ncbi:hypothetical protein X556_0969, partial [Chlamydia pneumoniae B21]
KKDYTTRVARKMFSRHIWPALNRINCVLILGKEEVARDPVTKYQKMFLKTVEGLGYSFVELELTYARSSREQRF